jgi:hypothetical protein
LVERELPERWAGKRLAELSVAGEVTLVAVTRAGVPRLDFGDLVGQEGDIIHLMVSDTALDRFRTRLEGAAAADRSRDANGSGAGHRVERPVPGSAEGASAGGHS